MLRRLFLGLLKGAVVGGALGALFHFAFGLTTVATGLNYLLYALVGGVAGVFAGQPPWRKGAWIGSILKGVFGLALGAGVYALGSRFLLMPVGPLPNMHEAAPLAELPLLFSPIVAAIYSTLVELDDGGEQPEEQPASGVRVRLEDIDVGEEEEQEAGSSRAAGKNKR